MNLDSETMIFDTVFDKILAKKIPTTIIFENEFVLAFKDIQPQSSVHMLVIPKLRASSMADFTLWNPEDIGNFFKSVAQVAEQQNLAKSGYRVVLNTGKNGCQSVEYVHAHILGGEQLSGSFS